MTLNQWSLKIIHCLILSYNKTPMLWTRMIKSTNTGWMNVLILVLSIHFLVVYEWTRLSKNSDEFYIAPFLMILLWIIYLFLKFILQLPILYYGLLMAVYMSLFVITKQMFIQWRWVFLFKNTNDSINHPHGKVLYLWQYFIPCPEIEVHIPLVCPSVQNTIPAIS